MGVAPWKTQQATGKARGVVQLRMPTLSILAKNNKVSVQNFLSIEMQEQFFLCRAATQLMHAIKMYSVRTICGTLTEKQLQGHLGHSSQRPVCLPPGMSSEKI